MLSNTFPLILGMVICTQTSHVSAQETGSLSLEDLASVPVVETSKQSARIFNAPVSAFVFDEETIDELPVDSVPEMLRYASGVQISRTTNGTWGVAIRGLNSRFVSRVLFTADEQNIYSTLYAGLFGNQHDLFLPDISSIEVVYGPGGTLWGNNAMNGMINVIMKPAFETEDTVLHTQIGSLNRNIGVRTGWAVNSNTSARVYATYHNRQKSESDRVDDEWTTRKAGFQMDRRISSDTLVTLSSEVFDSELGWAEKYGDPLTGAFMDLSIPEKQKGFNVQAKWNRQVSDTGGFTLRTWFGYTDMDAAYSDFEISVMGAEWRSRIQLTENQNLVFNAGGTLEKTNLHDTLYATFNKESDNKATTGHAGFEHTTSFFNDRLELTAGGILRGNSKQNDPYFLPTVRLQWSPNASTRIWSSFAKGQRDLQYALNNVDTIQINTYTIPPVSIPTPLGIVNVDKTIVYGQNTELEPEKLTAFECGIKHQVNQHVSLKMVAYNYKTKGIYGASLDSIAPVLTVQDPYLLSTLTTKNITDGEISGVEFTSDVKLSQDSRVLINYSFTHNNLGMMNTLPSELISLQSLTDVGYIANSVPEHLASIWWQQHWIGDHFSTNLGLRYASSVEPHGNEAIFQADLRLKWKITASSEISLVGRNLLKDGTDESNLTDMMGYETLQPREWYLEGKLVF